MSSQGNSGDRLSEIAIAGTSVGTDEGARDRARFLERHPCFSGKAHLRFGRIHLPVSPACNIGCLFCARGIRPIAAGGEGASGDAYAQDDVPGVASRVLSPAAAMAILEKALAICPEISVVGVAGPGDSLVGDGAIETLELAKARFPKLLACLSTNGLLLRDKVERLARVPIDSITVTVNSLRPATLEKINGRVVVDNGVLRGREAAEALIEAQLLGIAAAASQTKAVIKINTVLIPGLNDGEIAEIARRTAVLGATVMNVLPLIPQAGMAHRSAPDCAQLESARREAGAYLEVFRHCRHCRADAAGVMGRNHDIGRLLYGESSTCEESFSHG
jgi:nitrogen fixation protein NifB